jgi:hypothetical protein
MKTRLHLRCCLPVLLLLCIVMPCQKSEVLSAETVVVNTASASVVASSRWFRSEVDIFGDTGRHAAIAIDPYDDTPYIAYYDATNKDLRMAQYLGNGIGNCNTDHNWLCRNMDADDDVGMYNAIAFQPTEIFRLGISYYDQTYGALKYISFAQNATPWQIFTIDLGVPATSPAGLFTSLAFTSAGTPYIAYHKVNNTGADALMVAHYKGSGGNCGYGPVANRWQCDVIDTGEGMGQYTSIVVDQTGHIHIAYYDATNKDLRYATNAISSSCGPGNTWTCYPVDTIDDVGKHTSIYVDSSGNFHIAYYDETNGKLMYAYKVSSSDGNCGILGSAQCDEIDGMKSKYNAHNKGISMVQDPSGYPLIAYQSVYGDLNIARPLAALGLPFEDGNCGPYKMLYPSWICQTIHRSSLFSNNRHGDNVGVALNSAGLATIGYDEFITDAGGNLGVAYQRVEVFTPFNARNP